MWAAFFNFVAAFGFGVHVATTVGKGVVHSDVVDQWVILAGSGRRHHLGPDHVVVGLPTSSSHALIGGFAGAAMVKAGFGSLVASGLVKIGLFMVLAPASSALVVGFAMMVLTDVGVPQPDARAGRSHLPAAASSCRPPPTASATAPTTRRRRWGSWRCCSFTTGHLGREFYVPLWVILSGPRRAWRSARCAAAGGIVKTMGMRITKLRAGRRLLRRDRRRDHAHRHAALGGIPVSTTQTISGSIMGVGAIQRFSAVRWGVAGRILWAWVLTIPAAAIVAAATWMLLRLAGA